MPIYEPMRVGENSSGPAGFVLAAMSQSAVSGTRTASLPVDGMGAPDFEKIKAAGGRVDGILPGGNASMAVHGGGRPFTIYAAQITPADGSAPIFVKGVAADGKRVDERTAGDTSIANALQYVHDLPSSLAETQLRAWQTRADDARGAGGIDVVA